jgi:DNA-binding transcriptional LysR family regulator
MIIFFILYMACNTRPAFPGPDRLPFAAGLKSRWQYYVVYPEGALRQRKVKTFRDWLFSEMAAG